MTKVLPLLFILFLAGCQTEPHITADISSPKSAAMAYLNAIAAGDARTAQALSIGSPTQREWVAGRATLVDGMRKFDNALYAKFGNVTSQVHTDMHDSLLKLADFWIVCIGEGTASADDNNARIDPARKGFFTRFVSPIYLHREKEGWKVDLAKTYAQGTTPQEDANISDDYRQWRQFGEVFASVARDVKAGRFHNSDQASEALLNRLQSIRTK